MRIDRVVVVGTVLLAILVGWVVGGEESQLDMQRARELYRKQQQGQTLTEEEGQYLQKAMEARRAARGGAQTQPAARAGQFAPKEKTGLAPLCDMGREDRYKGEDGGLYGQGRNRPPVEHEAAAKRQLGMIRPVDAEGNPSPQGKTVLLSIGMSNTTQEFSAFKRMANRDPSKNPAVVIVDGAAGGMDVVAWVEGRHSRSNVNPWDFAAGRLKEAGVTSQQVQVIWLKQAKMGPAGWGEFPEHARKLADGMGTILNMAQEKFPNLKVAYLSSRIYAGYANGALNPEPYAYESAFSVRWLIERQIKGDQNLNYDPGKGAVKSPLLLWGPYLWADGVAGRKSDGMTWMREDLAGDGTHPSGDRGAVKVGRMLMEFFQKDELAKTWYTGRD